MTNWLKNVDWTNPTVVRLTNSQATFTVPQEGIFVAHLHAANYSGTRNTYCLLNGIDILSDYSNGDTSGAGGIFPVSKGDVVTIRSSENEYHYSRFYPYKLD